MNLSRNLRILIRVQKRVTVSVLAGLVYGAETDPNRRKIRRLMNGRVRPRIEDVIRFARVLDVNASDLAFGNDGVFSGYVEVENRFASNLRLIKAKFGYRTDQIARRLYPNKRYVDPNDERKARRLLNGIVRPSFEDIYNLCDQLEMSPSVLCFGVYP